MVHGQQCQSYVNLAFYITTRNFNDWVHFRHIDIHPLQRQWIHPRISVNRKYKIIDNRATGQPGIYTASSTDQLSRVPETRRVIYRRWTAIDNSFLNWTPEQLVSVKLWYLTSVRVRPLKGRVRIRKSKYGEKLNEKLLNDAYGILLYRCCTSKLCSWKCQILHHGCALKRERWAS